MALVAVDIDSTLYDFDTLARQASLQRWQDTGDEDYRRGIYYSSEDWRAPAELLGLEKWLDVISVCHDDEMILQQQPFAGAVETCKALVLEGHRLVYISNRKTETEEATRQWLYENDFLHGSDHTEVVITEGDKRPYITGAQYLIDDRLKTCVEFVYDYEWQLRYGPRESSPLPRRAFTLKYPYNQNGTDIPGLYLAPTWAGLNVYMASKGLLPEPAVKALA